MVQLTRQCRNAILAGYLSAIASSFVYLFGARNTLGLTTTALLTSSFPFSGIVMWTGGSYIFHDPLVSSPATLSSSPSLATALLAGLEYYENVTSFCAIPVIVQQMSKQCTAAGLEHFQNLHSLGVGGAPTPPTLFDWAVKHAIPYFDCSGATEAAGTICIRRALDPDQAQYGLQVIPGLMGSLEKIRLSDTFGELIITGTVCY